MKLTTMLVLTVTISPFSFFLFLSNFGALFFDYILYGQNKGDCPGASVLFENGVKHFFHNAIPTFIPSPSGTMFLHFFQAVPGAAVAHFVAVAVGVPVRGGGAAPEAAVAVPVGGRGEGRGEAHPGQQEEDGQGQDTADR